MKSKIYKQKFLRKFKLIILMPTNNAKKTSNYTHNSKKIRDNMASDMLN